MPINSREKGKRGELEVANLLKTYGYDCRRGQQYCGSNGDADVVGLPGIHIEVKRTEKFNLYKAIEQAKRDAREKEIPVVFHRKNGGEWIACTPVEEFMKVYGGKCGRMDKIT